MYEGYSTFGGIEIVNSQRAFVLSRAGGAGWYLKRGYPEIEDALGTPLDDPEAAPWYDAGQPELSSRFFGVYGQSLEGTEDSVRQIAQVENSADGLMLGAPRRAGRSLRQTVTLLARGRDALEYGVAWLQTVMATAGCGQSVNCDRADVLFFADIPGDADSAFALSRTLRYAGTTSGPFQKSRATSRGLYSLEMEWTWTSERPFIYGPARPIDVQIAEGFALIQDSPINYIPYPAAVLEETVGGYSRPTIARNVATNPALTVNATGWTGTASLISGSDPTPYFTSGRQQGIGADGIGTLYGYRSVLKGNGSTSASGSCYLWAISAQVDLTGVPAGRLIQGAIWADKMVLSGSTAVAGDLLVTMVFLTAADAIVTTQTCPADPRGNGLYTSPKMLVPATATKVYMQVRSIATWTSGNTDATNSEIRLYADGLTVAYFGGAG